MRRSLLVGVAGLVLVGLLGGWALLAHPGAPQSEAWARACGVVAAGLLVGVVTARFDPAVPGLLAFAVAVGAVVVTLPASLSGDPLAPPLGYMNANGALLLGGAAGAVVAVGPRDEDGWRLAGALAALVLAALCIVDGAQAAAVGCALLAAWAVARGRGSRGLWVGLGAVSIGGPLALTAGWAAGVVPRPERLVAALSEERFALWSEAWGLLLDHPLSGVGPGRFSQESPTAADPDLAWAHSALLQTGAELGWVGVGLLVALLVWGVVALGRDSVLLGVLLLPASIDYVFHFAGVLLVSSLVVGAALAPSAAPEPSSG